MEIAGIPRWAFLALSAISNLHNSLVNIDASSNHSKGTPNEGDANADLQTSVFKGNVYNGFISGDVLAQFKKQNKPPGYLAQLILSIIGPIVAIIGIFLPIMFPVFAAVEASATVAEEEITNLAATVATRLKDTITKPLTNIDKSAPFWAIVPGTAMAGGAGIWGKITSASTSATEALTDYQALLGANWEQSQTTLETYNDNLFNTSDWAAMLMTILWGGTYVAAPTYSMNDLIEAFTIDTTSKMINQIFQQYQTYVQFTDLGDDASGTKCKTDTHGPDTARYCADGGVYYVKAMTENGNIPNSAMPYGYSGLVGVNIQPWWISAASSKVYRRYHLTFNSSDVNAFTDTLGDLLASNVNSIKDLIGQLPGEWQAEYNLTRPPSRTDRAAGAFQSATVARITSAAPTSAIIGAAATRLWPAMKRPVELLRLREQTTNGSLVHAAFKATKRCNFTTTPVSPPNSTWKSS
ncbi:hypothetical protein ABVK25_008664 [Lepraria finkii]|uniref:Uncharacterized protein n=1 Tax=Lepraria finkii TaxID=1340010 RepID=A0ABR4B011_9LECA